MPAAIASNGTTDLFASHREPAWHGLGTVFTEEVTDYMRMLDLAGLSGWNVREEDLHLDTTHDVEWEVSAKAIVATMGDTERVLGVTGSRYEIVQNEDAFSFLQSLHDGARWETAGALKGGRVVFGSMAFDRDFVLDPTGVADVVKSYLLVHTSHDGSTGVAGGVTPIRVVCQNTLNLAIGKGITQKFNIRHTIKADERMRAETEAWRVAHTYMDAFEAEAASLYAQKVTDSKFFGLVETLFPQPTEDKKGAQAKWENKRDMFAQAWNGKPNAGIKNTGWGALNALTEANQWGRKTQNTKNGSENFAAAGAGFDIPTNTFRNTALAAVKALA
jgi:phage/plasmid-like protein (TIGR03299 family)